MAKNNFISLGTDPLRVEFSGGYSIEDKGLYDFFKLFPAGEYDQQFQKALRLGVYALEEERIAAFLGRAENELDAGLERLKVIYKMVHLKEKSAGKGAVAEVELADVLQEYIDSMNWGDGVSATGEKIGVIPRRKVGDLVVAINNTGVKVVIESKMDTSVPVGDPVDLDERSKKSGNPEKSAYGQNLTALVNREAQVAISVFDKASASASIRNLDDIVFQPELPGFIVKIDRARGGYAFDNGGAGNAANHPVQTVNWWDCLKWCNARSVQAGLIPVYYVDAGMTEVYAYGQLTPYVNWSANGYRLPTEAEWEKAARGGLIGQRFPWGDSISESQANYYGLTSAYNYDLGPSGYNSMWTGMSVVTSPVGYYAPNGYGLFDMAGNVWEWCWDRYGAFYGQPSSTNPTGPTTGNVRVFRGGNWANYAPLARCAQRNNATPNSALGTVGFRCVKGH